MRRLISLTIGLSVSMAQAAAPTPQSGWSGRLNLSGLYVNSQSQFNTHSDNATTNALDSSAATTEQYLVVPLVGVNYTQANLRTQWFIDYTQEHINDTAIQYELGVSHRLASGTQVTFGVSPQLPYDDETWRDPYLTGSDRETTDQSTWGTRIAFDNIQGGLASIHYAYGSYQVEDEQSGSSSGLSSSEQDELDRDSQNQQLSFNYMLPLSRSLFVVPSLQLSRYQAQGISNRYSHYQVGVTAISRVMRHALIASASLGRSVYDTEHPLFDEKPDATNWSLFAVYSYAAPFGWENTKLSLMGGYSESDSQVSFFDSQGLFTLIGLDYAL
jgi:hypothetical protein